MYKEVLERLKNTYRKVFRKTVTDDLAVDYSVKSYSLEGEDLILRIIFKDRKSGFYVDVGASHPFRFSNTQCLYEMGWQGINIDPLPEAKRLFDKARPKDINLTLGISTIKGEKEFYLFDEPPLSTFDKGLAYETDKNTDYKIKEIRKMPTDTLENILDIYAPGKRIDLMNIDAEGYEEEVIRSSNWKKYRPEILLIEARKFDWKNLNTPIHDYLSRLGYAIFAKTPMTALYRDIHQTDGTKYPCF